MFCSSFDQWLNASVRRRVHLPHSDARGGERSGTLDGYYWVRDVQSGPPLGPSRNKGSEAGCRLSSGSSKRSKCPPPRFVRGGRAAGRRPSVPNGDSRRVSVVESSRSTRARRGSVDVSVVMFGDLLARKRQSKPSKMSDRSASLRRCSTTASGRESFPRSAGSPGSAETTRHARCHPIACHVLRVAADRRSGRACGPLKVGLA